MSDAGTNLKRLIELKSRRLQVLKERSAIQGTVVDPSVLIEIEDIEREIEKLKGQLDDLQGKIRVDSSPNTDSSVKITGRKLRVFLCHASQDKPVVRDLYKRLSAESWVQPWLDEEELLPGQDWNLEIEKAVESSDAVVICISNVSVAREGYVQKELRQVLDIALEKVDGTIFVIPVRLDDCPLPRQLRDKQALDFFPDDRRDSAFKKLTESLKIRKDALGI